MAMTDPNHFSTQGISVFHFLQIILSWQRTNPDFHTLTTAQVCHRFLKPTTQNSGLSLCAQILLSEPKDNPSPVIQPATFFISHTWGTNFSQCVQAITDFIAEERRDFRNTYIWFDLFANSQHGTAEKGFLWWETVFMNAVKGIGRVVLVLGGLDGGPVVVAAGPLTRAWCIFEVYACVVTKSEFYVAVLRVGRGESDENVRTVLGSSEQLVGLLEGIKSCESESLNPGDKEAIFEVVRETVGFEALDEMVKETLTEWLVRRLRANFGFLRQQQQSRYIMQEDQLNALKNLSLFLVARGRFGQAKEYLDQYIMSIQLWRFIPSDTPLILNTWAQVLKSEGSHGEAEVKLAESELIRQKLGMSESLRWHDLLQDIASIRTRILGDKHFLTLRAKLDLCKHYYSFAAFEQVEIIARECFEASRNESFLDGDGRAYKWYATESAQLMYRVLLATLRINEAKQFRISADVARVVGENKFDETNEVVVLVDHLMYLGWYSHAKELILHFIDTVEFVKVKHRLAKHLSDAYLYEGEIEDSSRVDMEYGIKEDYEIIKSQVVKFQREGRLFPWNRGHELERLIELSGLLCKAKGIEETGLELKNGAMPMLEFTLEGCKEEFGEEDYKTGAAAALLAWVYRKQGREEEALALEHEYLG
ncbi:hypothetical protein BCR33DRAFT_232151 [Rhizoclosmatium globosum]|uniref:Uncharacterized protein n=1 Tax=Rhizoclosmatium globosum TaxID=329046 RepID=A0A1Y2CAT5_9FUNG|nr:hypothetical protein BCR33DRAFT_232151 [Rhizoclosmatium globosum]|eukprot:ORY43954.1 hypothetical protein BCR33DRAFT_232151 [Rhizoclosmatium globosum]